MVTTEILVLIIHEGNRSVLMCFSFRRIPQRNIIVELKSEIKFDLGNIARFHNNEKLNLH